MIKRKTRSILLAVLMLLTLAFASSFVAAGQTSDSTVDETSQTTDHITTAAAIGDQVLPVEKVTDPRRGFLTSLEKIRDYTTPSIYDMMEILLITATVVLFARWKKHNKYLNPSRPIRINSEIGQQARDSQLITDGGQRMENVSLLDAKDDRNETARKLHIVTQSTRRQLLLKIVCHPDFAPSMKELEFQCPNLTRSGIKDHLRKLQNIDIVKKVELEPGNDARKRDLPHIFWTFTEDGVLFLQKYEVIPTDVNPLQKVYERTEKPDQIQEYQNTPRPDNIPSNMIGNLDDAEEVDEILEEFNQTGDADKVAEELARIEDENETSDQPHKELSGTLKQLLQTVHVLEKKIKKLEEEIRDSDDRRPRL